MQTLICAQCSRAVNQEDRLIQIQQNAPSRREKLPRLLHDDDDDNLTCFSLAEAVGLIAAARRRCLCRSLARTSNVSAGSVPQSAGEKRKQQHNFHGKQCSGQLVAPKQWCNLCFDAAAAADRSQPALEPEQLLQIQTPAAAAAPLMARFVCV